MAEPAASRSAEFARIRMAFGTSPHFRELPPASLDRLAAISRLQRYDEGGSLHAPGVEASRFWFVLAGALRVSWSTVLPGGVPIGVIVEGSFYSPGAFVEGATMQTEAVAERGTVTAVIQGRDLRTLLSEDPDVALLAPRLLLNRFQGAMSSISDLLSAPLPQRLARRIMAYAISSGRIGDTQELELRVAQTDLAAMLGASRSRVNTQLRNFERQGILRLGYRRLFVLDFDRLCKIAGPQVAAF
ncbi:MAG TPA: Crp/Fnr family transcriptional regulator [Ramlibacter sp.]|nr:Crp/Fnr family transcriptional regulator [Ramlibacter sp.]